jgi:phospholipase C
MKLTLPFIAGACAVLFAGGCSGTHPQNADGALPAVAQSSAWVTPSKYIRHVVLIVQENRSFDNIFSGFPGADSQLYGYTSSGEKIALHQTTFFSQDIPHGFEAAIEDWDNGKMDGFNRGETSTGSQPPTAAYSFLERSEVAPYWDMAKQYVLADHMFPTMFGGSFTAHLDLIASTANIRPDVSEADFPTSRPMDCNAPPGTLTHTINLKRILALNGPFPCFTQFETLANRFDGGYVTWKYYAPPVPLTPNAPSDGGGIWSQFAAIKGVRYGRDWKKNIVSATPETTVLHDIAGGKLPNVSWVIPDIANSDHASSKHDTGPSWVGTVVNAVGRSKYWNSTAIIVLWDDWGGWYDDLPPPQKDFRGLGIRVPCIIISPYVKPHVTHTIYEFGSILRFVEQVFGLEPLALSHTIGSGYTDERGASLIPEFDFTQTPRVFVPIKTKYPASHFLNERPSYLPPDTE